jgi:hypothetical protein
LSDSDGFGGRLGPTASMLVQHLGRHRLAQGSQTRQVLPTCPIDRQGGSGRIVAKFLPTESVLFQALDEFWLKRHDEKPKTEL